MSITIVGPRSVGKSTISKALSYNLNYDYVSADNLMNINLKDHGGLEKTIKDGKIELIMERGPRLIKNAFLGERIILDLAGGAISSKIGSKEIVDIITKKSFVLGLLPFEKPLKESMELLYEREIKKDHFQGVDQIGLYQKVTKDYIILEPVLKRVANSIIYVERKDPLTIVNEAISLFRLAGAL